jgi:diguanylate cyclase (GGDEF)-like protein/PAS domain S-box-containing protein
MASARKSLFARLQALTDEPRQLYKARDRASAEIRARHVRAVAQLSPYTMSTNLLLAGLIAVLLWESPVSPALVVWLCAVVACSGWALWSWWSRRERHVVKVSPTGMHRATAHAAVFACIWGFVPLVWFADAPPVLQLVIATLMAGALALGALALATVPAAAITLVGILTACSAWALIASGQPMLLMLLAPLALYSFALCVSALLVCKLFNRRLMASREAVRQGQVVGLLLRDFEEHSTDVLWEVDRHGQFVHVSRKLSELLALPPQRLQKLRFAQVLNQLCPATMKPEGAAGLQAAMVTERAFRDLTVPVEREGHVRWWSITAKPLLDEVGRNVGWRGVISDVTQERQAHQRLAYLAHYDSLTGLANRVQLRERLAQAVEQGTDAPRRSALMCLDVDNFKTINDSLGHSVGDAVLQAVARRLQSHMRMSDLVARLGGDEFAIVMDDVRSDDEAPSLAQRLVAAMKQPCDVGGRSISIGVSIGVALIPDHGNTVDEVLGNADLALYAAKDAGRGRYELFAPRMGARHRRRLSIEHELRQALHTNAFELHFQPQIDIAGWSIIGIEALLRWRHPVLGLVPPGEFIPVAEEAGLIADIGMWVLGQACSEAASHVRDIRVSVNVSPVQLLRPDFVHTVEAALQRSGLAPALLEIEITESLFIDEVPLALSNLHAIRQMGVRIALDDFGTGYSSLAYLRRFPFDTLKIDRAFVRELMTRSDARAIVRTIIQLAGTLGMSTVAEGVEEPAQLEVLQRAQCHAIQGYLAARPMPMADLRMLIAHWDQRPRPSSHEELPESVLSPLTSAAR